MLQQPLVALIMAGGSGTRFWPLSVAGEPKQFLKLLGQRSMLMETWRRLDGLIPPERRLVITDRRFAARTLQELPDLPPANLLAEPEQRDTAAAAIYGAAFIQRRWPQAVILTLPADHLIEPAEKFRHVAAAAAAMADQETVLGTIGVPPLYPASCYGYIERGAPLKCCGTTTAYRVLRFAEKPTVETARKYLANGGWYWNAGIFIWRSDVFLDEARRHMPQHFAVLSPLAGEAAQAAMSGADAGPEFLQRLAAQYGQLTKISVDFGIMEKTDRGAVVQAEFQWSDLGGWLALGDRLPSDAAGNRTCGPNLLQDCRNTIIYNQDGQPPVMCLGLDGLVVVQTAHGVLVCPKDRLEQIKAAVAKLPPG